MDADLLEADRVQSIVGGFYAVYNYYRYGLSEAVYAGALELELTKRGHHVARELAISVSYRGQHVAWQRLDMVVDDAVIVENKATEKLSPNAKPQLVSYLRASSFEVGLLRRHPLPSAYVRLPDPPNRGYAMAMAVQHGEWTAELARALPDDGNRYEVLDGELFVTPAPALLHQRALLELYDRLKPYVITHGLGEVLLSPADIAFSPKRLVQPDLFVIPEAPSGRRKTWSEVRSLLLAVEALSPTTARADRIKKRRIYQDEGVPEYWIIDLDARVIERWRPEDERPEILADTLVWQPRTEIEPLTIDLEEYFTAVLD